MMYRNLSLNFLELSETSLTWWATFTTELELQIWSYLPEQCEIIWLHLEKICM